MNTPVLDTEVLDLVADTFNLDRSLLMPHLTVEDLGLDSLDVLKLTHAVEKRYRINLALYSHTDVSSLGRLVEILHLETARQRAKA